MIKDANNWGWEDIARMARSDNRRMLRAQNIIIIAIIIVYACIILL